MKTIEEEDGMRRGSCAFLFFCLIFALPAIGFTAACPKDGPKPLLLQPEALQTFIGDHAAILEDPTGALDYDAVRRADWRGAEVENPRQSVLKVMTRAIGRAQTGEETTVF